MCRGTKNVQEPGGVTFGTSRDQNVGFNFGQRKALPVFLVVTAIFHAKIVTISLIPSSFLLSVSFTFGPCTYIIQLYSLTSTVKIKYTRYSLFSPYLYKHLGSQFRKSEFSHESVSKQIPGTCVKFISLKLPGVFLPLNMQLWRSNFAI